MKVLGYFMEHGIWSGGVEQPPRKTSVVAIDTGLRNLDDVAPDEDIHVLSAEGNWYTIKRSELMQEAQNG